MVMQIQELNSLTKLFDAYGKLLSNKQYEVMDKFLNMDISASEMAELENGSRQAIHDALTKAKKQLVEFEEKCGVVKTKENCKTMLEKARAFLSKSDESEKQAIDLIDETINNL
jgi:predicted DNA-binding protein YlxM (UPF0122 family)